MHSPSLITNKQVGQLKMLKHFTSLLLEHEKMQQKVVTDK